MPASEPERPKLRQVTAERVEHDGAAFFVIGDPRRMASRALLVRQELGPFLALADGTKTVEEIIVAGADAMGTSPSANGLEQSVKDMFEELDGLFLLEGAKFSAEVARQLEEYRTADFRTPALEGKAYPEDPDDLLDMFEGFAPDVSDEQEPTGRALKVIVTPHIDFARGGDTYAELWRHAAPDLEDIELAVVFGTDHNGNGPRLTLTRQSYATPWNIMPTDKDLVGRLAKVLQSDSTIEDHPFADEFNHVNEHSIELASVWLNWAVGDRAVQMLPVLCGSFGDYVLDDGELRESSPADHTQIADAIGMLQQVARHRKTVFIAAADLCHVGPAFGDSDEADEEFRREIEEYDSGLMDAVIKGEHKRFLELVRESGDVNRVCGLAPISLALWAAEATDGHWMGYRQCQADSKGASIVSIAGALLY